MTVMVGDDETVTNWDDEAMRRDDEKMRWYDEETGWYDDKTRRYDDKTRRYDETMRWYDMTGWQDEIMGLWDDEMMRWWDDAIYDELVWWWYGEITGAMLIEVAMVVGWKYDSYNGVNVDYDVEFHNDDGGVMTMMIWLCYEYRGWWQLHGNQWKPLRSQRTLLKSVKPMKNKPHRP